MKIKRVIDISRKIYPGMAVWPGDTGPDITREELIRNGGVCNLSSIHMGVHTGTHIDAPLHFIDEAKDVGNLDLSRFIGFVNVFELDVKKFITSEDIKDLPIKAGDIVFFKTLNSEIPEEEGFRKDYIYFDRSAAELLIQIGVKTVGFDYFSIDGYGLGCHPVHQLILSHEIGVIEGLYLKEVKAGTYFFSCLPLRISGVDGSPVRAVLLETDA
jgi:arylformamidase